MDNLPLGYDIRYTELGDLDFLKRCLTQEETLHWFVMSDQKEIDQACQGWVALHRFQASLTAVIDGEPCGMGSLFLMPYKKVKHECLIKMVVDPNWRRRGIGRSILKNLLHLARSKFFLEIVYLEIFEGNPIERLLQEFGFSLAARQEAYFKDKNRYFARLLYERDLLL